MCGIVGFISTKTGEASAKKYFMKHALALDTLRGRDSTGLFTVCNKDNVKSRHSLKEGIDWVNTKGFNDTKFDVWAAVGHNRAATVGNVNRNNAHPFTFGAVTMVHNGTLHDDGWSLKTYDQDLEVDSMQICKALSETKPENAYKVLERLDGAFALVWFDTRDNSVNMARNNSRPFHFTHNLAKDHLWFMSDGTHLTMLNKLFGASGLQGSTVYSLKAYRHLKFSKGSLLPVSKEFKEYKRVIPAKKSNVKGSLKNAAKNWQDSIRRFAAGDKEPVREEINGKKRRVPDAMGRLVKQLFDLPTDLHLEFVPGREYEGKNKKLTVMGEVVIPDWGDCEWPMTIYNVPMASGRAYMQQTWLVQPVGVTHSGSDYYDQNLLGHLIHTNYEKWFEGQEEVQDEEEVDLIVPGPDGRMMKQSVVKKLQAQGCIQCSDTIDGGEIYHCHIVNNGQDLICQPCHEEMDSAIIPYGAASNYTH